VLACVLRTTCRFGTLRLLCPLKLLIYKKFLLLDPCERVRAAVAIGRRGHSKQLGIVVGVGSLQRIHDPDSPSEGEGEVLPGIKIKENESFEGALKRFKKQCEKAGLMYELRRREYYEKPSVRKKKKSMAARKRAIKKLRAAAS